MITLHTFKRTLWCASLFVILSTNAATRFVTNLLDDGSPGSLRTTIASANSGDTILFGVSGTIFLEAANGELVINKKLAIDGEEKIIIDGGNAIATGLHVIAGGGNSDITSLTIQNFSDAGGTEQTDVHGILIDNGASDCSIQNCTIQNLTSTNINPQTVYGILSKSSLNLLIDNTVTKLTRGDDTTYQGGGIIGIDAAVQGLLSNNIVSDCLTGKSDTISGQIIGIITVISQGDCSNNNISNCSSGEANNSSGSTTGITLTMLNGSCSNNTISNCSTGDSNNSSSAMTGILLNIVQGSCSNNTVSNCSTGDSSISGITVGIQAQITDGSCSGNVISDCSTGDSSISGVTIGIQAQITDGSCSGNVISDCSTGESNNSSGTTVGINLNIIQGSCSDNTITNLSSGNAGQNSGNVAGILLDAIQASCFNNNITNLSSGIALESGLVQGISFEIKLGTNSTPSHVIKNKVTNLFSGEAISRGYAQGITIENLNENSHIISCNIIKIISGGEDLSFEINNTVGLRIDQGNQLTIQANAISDITGENGQFTTGIQLGGANRERVTTPVTNSLVSHNIIKNITDTTSGFGITILSENSSGNSLLSNSIFDTSDKAINILDNFLDGENISPFTDAIVTLSSVNCTNRGKIKVTGAIEPQMGLDGQPFLLQFFVSDTNPPAQAKTLIFEYLLTGSENNNFDLTFTPAVSTNFGQYISATATAQVTPPAHNWNTSEVSNALPSCDSVGSPYSPFICPEVPAPTPPFDCGNCPFMQNSGDAFDIL